MHYLLTPWEISVSNGRAQGDLQPATDANRNHSLNRPTHRIRNPLSPRHATASSRDRRCSSSPLSSPSVGRHWGSHPAVLRPPPTFGEASPLRRLARRTRTSTRGEATSRRRHTTTDSCPPRDAPVRPPLTLGVGVTSTHDLHTDRQTVDQACRDGADRVTGEVERLGEQPSTQGLDLGAVDLGRVLPVWERRDAKRRRHEQVVYVEGLDDAVVHLRSDDLGPIVLPAARRCGSAGPRGRPREAPTGCGRDSSRER